MGKDRAGESEVRLLRALAADPGRASSTKTATTDMMAHHLTRADVCDALWDWIHEGTAVTRTIMHGQDAGQFAYEIWPELAGRRFYCKFMILGEPSLSPKLFIVSVHPDRPEAIRPGGQS